MNFSITKEGRPLDLSFYTWDGRTRTLSTRESGLVLDFLGVNGVTFKTGNNCTFITGYSCVFNTIMSCIFKTGHSCTFKTGSKCTFDTADNCTFDTGFNCTFKTDLSCIFNTGSDCIFITSSGCTFDAGHNCTFKTGKECVIIRKDIYEVIEIPENVKIKLNDFRIKGYTVISERETIEIAGSVYHKGEVERRIKELKPVR